MSAPETILVELPLGGVDAYTESKWIVPGKLAELENARFDAPPGLNKRNGYTKMSIDLIDTGQIDGCRRLAYMQGETCIFGLHKFYARAVGQDLWMDRGAIPEAMVSNLKVASDLRYDLTNAEVAYNGNIGVAVWQNNSAAGVAALGTLNCIVFSRPTGEVLSAQQITTPGFTPLEHPHTFAVGNYIYVVGLGDVNKILWTRIDSASLVYTFPVAAPLKDSGGADLTNRYNATADYHYDVSATSSEFFVIYRTSTPSLMVHRFGTASANSLANHPLADDPDRCVAISATGFESVSIVWSKSAAADFKHEVLNISTLANVAGPASIALGGVTNFSRASLVRISSTRRLVVAQEGSKGLRWATIRTDASGGVAGSVKVLDDLSLISKFFTDSSRCYVCGCFDSSEQGTGYLLEIGLVGQADGARDPRWVASFKRGRVSPLTSPSYLPNVPQHELFAYDLPFRTKQRFRFAGKDDQDIVISQHWIERARFHLFAPLTTPDFVDWGQSTFIAQGRPSWYDGVTYQEHGFAWHPEQPSATFTIFSGGVFAGGVQLNAQVVYEAIDARGMLCRSTPSAVANATNSTGAGRKFTLTLNNGLGLTDRSFTSTNYWNSPRTPCHTVPYRTIDGPGVEFFRAKSPPIGSDTASGTLINLGTTGFNETDTDIQAYELLYTEGDILNNDETPPCRLCIAHGDPLRMWLAGLEEDDVLAFSQPYVVGEAPRFNEGLRVRIGKPVTAIGGMDDKVVVWSASEVFIIAGNGPPASGDIDVGFRVHLLTSDVGCIAPRSVVSTPQGLMFQSAKGIYLLGRDLSVRYIGAPIRRVLESFPNINGAALLAAKNEVRFAATNESGEVGRLFVYDYAQDQWSVDVIPGPPISCTMLGDSFAWATIAGQVYIENAGFADGLSSDINNWIVMRLVTPWITPRMIQGPSGTLQGWQGLRSVGVLGDNLGSHGLRIRVGYDYESTYADDKTFTAAEVAAFPHEHVQYTPTRMNCKAFRVEVRDVAGTAINEGMRLSSLSFEVDVDRRRSLLASAQVR